MKKINDCEGRPSIFFWTTHKCASTFASLLLTEIADQSNMRYLNIAGAIAELGNRISMDDPYFIETAIPTEVYSFVGNVYGPLRKPFDIPGANLCKNIFFLRDPRDVLVSAYYSFGSSHSLPGHNAKREKFLDQRRLINQLSLDEYCQWKADDWILPLYDEYIEKFNDCPKSFFFRYEDYVSDPFSAFQSLFAFILRREPKASRSKWLAKKASPVRKMEDPSLHRRSGETRQFEKKLGEKTQEVLAKKFEKLINFWGFEP